MVEQPEPGPTPVPSPSIYCEKFIIDAGARTITIDDSEWDSLSAEVKKDYQGEYRFTLEVLHETDRVFMDYSVDPDNPLEVITQFLVHLKLDCDEYHIT